MIPGGESVPLVLRLALSAAVFVVGGVKVFQMLTPRKSLMVLPEHERRRMSGERAPFALVWGVAVTTLFAGAWCLFPSGMLLALDGVGEVLRNAVEAVSGPEYPRVRGTAVSAVGPVPVPPRGWMIAMGAIGAAAPLLLYAAWKERNRLRSWRAVSLAVTGLSVEIMFGAVGSVVVDDVSLRAYREALGKWIDRMSPAPPSAVRGREGPVVLYARPALYREVEPGILYRRTMEVTESGEVVPRELINEFTVDGITVKARPGEDLVVSGVPSSYEGVIITQEPLRIGGYLVGGALEARFGLPLYIAPADHRRWRRDLETLWSSVSWGQRAASVVYLAYYVLAAAWGIGIAGGCLAGMCRGRARKDRPPGTSRSGADRDEGGAA